MIMNIKLNGTPKASVIQNHHRGFLVYAKLEAWWLDRIVSELHDYVIFGDCFIIIM
jgi:hypothetical protein